MKDFMLQQGAVALPLAVVLVIFAYDNKSESFSVLLWFLATFLVWIGYKSFDIARKAIKDEANKNNAIELERRRDSNRIISLLETIAENVKQL